MRPKPPADRRPATAAGGRTDREDPRGGAPVAVPKSAHDLAHEPRGLARGLADLDAGGLEGLLLGVGGARRTGDDRARVAHGLAGRGGEAGDVAYRRLGHGLLDELGPLLLG